MASVAMTAVTATLALAQPPSPIPALSTPALSVLHAGHGKVAMTVTAGESGAPAGFAVWWMKYADFRANGSKWFNAAPDPIQGEAYFTGEPTIHTGGGLYRTFVLGPNETGMVEIGDLYDESGLTSNSLEELAAGENYVFAAYALESETRGASALTPAVRQRTMPQADCTYNRGYWVIDPDKWPLITGDGGEKDAAPSHSARVATRPRPQAVDTVAWELPLGSVPYNKPQTQSILTKVSGISEPDRPVPARGGNLPSDAQPDPSATLIALAHQLIAAKLNQANGATVPAIVLTAIQDADALIGPRVVPPVGTDALAPGVNIYMIQTLGDYNNGLIGPGMCITTPLKPATWGALKRAYR